MKTQSIISTILFALTLVFASVSFAAETGLDGKTFTVTMKGQKGEADTLVFSSGKLHSLQCDQYGFKEGAYTQKKASDAIEFESTQINDKGDRNEWKGRVIGNTITGTLVHTGAKSNKPIEMPFEGKIKG